MMAPSYTSSHLWIPTLGGSVAAVYLLPIITILDTVMGWTHRATININIVSPKILDIYCSTIQSPVLCMQQA